MWQRLCELLERSQELHILVFGDFMLDRYLYGDAERISPEAPVPVLRVVRQEDALGGAGSVVADIAALRAVPHCVGVVGDDPVARVIEVLLQKTGADPSGLIRAPGRPTTLKTRLVGLAQHRHRQQLIRVDDESVDPVDGPTAEALLAQVERHLDQCHAVCIEDYNKGVVTPRLARAVTEAASRRGVSVLVDPASLTDYARYAGATIITPNRTETEKLTGLKLRDVAAVRQAAARILAACHTQYACVTLDADGAALIGPNGFFEHIPTRARDVYDVTGAGDEVLAALAVAIAAGGTMSEAVALANVAGGLEVEKFGCVPIRRDDMIGEILLENHKTLGKIRHFDQLLPELDRRRGRGETVAFTNGCFDILHAGHVANFAFCKQHADVLVVGLNSDASVKRQAKGAGRPIINQEDRAAVLAALADVDYVIVFDDDTPLALIQAVRPDVLVKGRDWEGKTVVGQECVEESGGKVLLAPLVEGRSTTAILDLIRGSRPPCVIPNGPVSASRRGSSVAESSRRHN
ncbi:MAG: bifunctional heptose 7-phosphate kinase/heptose 1-phosphate adenyltransferase [Phycisphaerae bacterium]|nr:bifunctional heptose 7-phosphate kinase/heptose 1-phosphate adenyltransferase [Phycisphaerae bacterium]